MKYRFDVLANRKNTNSVKYDEYNSCLPMWVADMDFLLAPKIKEALQKDLDVGAIGYTTIPDAFFEAFVNLYHRRYGTDFVKEDLVYVNGVVAAIDSIMKEVCEKGDNIVMLSPIYHTFFHCIENNGLHPLTSEMVLNEETYSINYVDLEEKLANPKSKLFVLCNPHNPMGRIFSKEELKKIEDLCNKHNVLIVSDEIHGLLTNPGIKYVPFSNAAKTNHYIVCLATSKAFNLAGLHSAVIVCKDKTLRERMQAVFYRDDIGEANYFAVNANIAALNDSEDWLDEVNEYIYINKIYLKGYIKQNIPSINAFMSDATYMMWVDCRKVTNNSKEFVNELNKETGLLVCPGIQFGQNGEGFFRINLATSLENVKLAAQKLEEFIKG